MALAVLFMKKTAKGFTLIEVIVAMVVIGIGLTGVLSVMMTCVNNSISPELSWQINTLGENMVNRLVSLQGPSGDGCVANTGTSYKVICDYQGLDHARLRSAFPELADIEDAKNITVSVRIAPYEIQDTWVVSVKLSHVAVGDTYFSAIKAKGTSR